MESSAVRAPLTAYGAQVRTIARTGAIAGMVGGAMMAMFQMVVGAIASSPTAVPGIDSSFWTAVEAIPTVIFGDSLFHGSFSLGSVVLGLVIHMMMAMMAGVALVTAVRFLVGSHLTSRSALLSGAAIGMAFGLVMEVVGVNLIVNTIQDPEVLYRSVPEWSWWVAHLMFGVAAGMVGVHLLRRVRGGAR